MAGSPNYNRDWWDMLDAPDRDAVLSIVKEEIEQPEFNKKWWESLIHEDHTKIAEILVNNFAMANIIDAMETLQYDKLIEHVGGYAIENDWDLEGYRKESNVQFEIRNEDARHLYRLILSGKHNEATSFLFEVDGGRELRAPDAERRLIAARNSAPPARIKRDSSGGIVYDENGEPEWEVPACA
ncbi:MAG: hypothetical protein AAF468_12380 [Pseudomonadota bacterium]